MNANGDVQALLSLRAASRRPAVLGISALALLLLCACAARKPVGVASTESKRGGSAVLIEPASLAVISGDAPAAVSLAAGSGKVAYGGDRAGTAARSVIEPPNLHDPGLEMAAGPIGVVLAPFAAAYGALSAGHYQVPAAALAKAEAGLASAMQDMAQQRHLRDLVREALGVQAHGDGWAPASARTQDPLTDGAATVLETKVEELRLERTGSADTSFALTINSRVRVSRAADGVVLYDRPFRYRSGTALYLDWTDPGVLENVAKTGYRELAQHIAGGFKIAAAQGPVLVGAGYKHPSPRPAASPALFAAHRISARVPAVVQVVDYPVADPDRIGIYSSEVRAPVTLQRPLTKDEAALQAIQDVQSSLDNLHNSRNSVVQLSAVAVAIPWSLCKQAVAGVRGVTSHQLQAAEARLLEVARNPDLQRKLAHEVAMQVTPRLSPRAVLVGGSKPAGAGREETALGVEVISAALTGDDEVNPSLALCVEARAAVFRPSDGVQLYSWPIHYRSSSHKFAQWAAADARLLRDELDRCHRRVAEAIVDQLAARSLIGPDRASQTILANN